MKKPYFSMLGAIICGPVTVLAIAAIFSDEIWVPLAGLIWTPVFGVSFMFFLWRVLRYYTWVDLTDKKQGRDDT
jgi:hypothetical protein